MNVIVQVVGATNGKPTPHDGRYVVRWNSNTGAGDLELTSTENPRGARHFENAAQVMIEWREQSRIQPKRPWDGQPNRPLAGITITIIPVPWAALDGGA